MTAPKRIKIILLSSIASGFLIIASWTIYAVFFNKFSEPMSSGMFNAGFGFILGIPPISMFYNHIAGILSSIILAAIFTARDVWNKEEGLSLKGVTFIASMVCGLTAGIIIFFLAEPESAFMGVAIVSAIFGIIFISMAHIEDRWALLESIGIGVQIFAVLGTGFFMFAGTTIGLIPGFLYAAETALMGCLSFSLIILAGYIRDKLLIFKANARG